MPAIVAATERSRQQSPSPLQPSYVRVQYNTTRIDKRQQEIIGASLLPLVSQISHETESNPITG